MLAFMLPSKKPHLGLAMIELVVALGILALLASIMLPSFNRYQKSMAVNQEAQKLLGLLRQAQQRAVSEQVKYSLEFDLQNQTYRLLNEQTGTTVESLNVSTNLQLTNLSGFTNNRATFNPMGAVDAEGTVTLSNDTGQNAIIEVKASGYTTYTKS